MRTNCPNCGAPLSRNGECRYCNTCVPAESTMKSTVTMDANKISFCIESVAVRDEKGILRRQQYIAPTF